MKKLILIALSLSITSCGPTTEELEALAKKNLDIATVTCNIISESPTYDAAMRIKEVNLGREKIGEDLFLGKDKEIAESFVYGLCRELVLNDPEYSNKLNEQILIAEQLRLKEEQEAERLRLEAERLRLEEEQEAERLRIKHEEYKRLKRVEILSQEVISLVELSEEWVLIFNLSLSELQTPELFGEFIDFLGLLNNKIKFYLHFTDDLSIEDLKKLKQRFNISVPLMITNPRHIWDLDWVNTTSSYLIRKDGYFHACGIGQTANCSGLFKFLLENFSNISSSEIKKDIETQYKDVKDIIFKSPNDFNSSANYLSSSDFDLFVLRVHVLSSLENAEAIADEIKKGGYPSFIEPLESNNDLHAVYVGPFLSKKEIKDNLGEIQNISESNQSEIIRWKL